MLKAWLPALTSRWLVVVKSLILRWSMCGAGVGRKVVGRLCPVCPCWALAYLRACAASGLPDTSTSLTVSSKALSLLHCQAML